MAEMKKEPGKEGTVTQYQAENIAINSLEQAGFSQQQIAGNAEVKSLVEEFGRTHENQPRKEVEVAAEELRAEWEKREGTEFKAEKPAKVEKEVPTLETIEITGEAAPEEEERPVERVGLEKRPERTEAAEPTREVREGKFVIKKGPNVAMESHREKEKERERMKQFAESGGMTMGTDEFRLAFRRANIEYKGWLEQKKAEPSEVLFAQFLGERKPAQEAPAEAPQEAETEIASTEIVPVEEAPGDEEMVFTPEEVYTPKELLEVAFEEQGVDYKGFREEYAKIMKRLEGNSDPAEIAAANEEAAELTKNSLEKIRGVESEIRKKFEGKEDVLAELNTSIGKIEGTMERSLARAAEHRAKIEEAPVEVAAAEAPKKTDEEAQRLVDIIQRNQADAVAEAAAREAPEVAKVEPEKKKEPAKAPGPEEVAQAEKDIYHPKDEKREKAMAILQEDAKRKEAAPEVVAKAPEAEVEETPAEVAAPEVATQEQESEEAKRKEKRDKILAGLKIDFGPEIDIGTGSTANVEELESQLGQAATEDTRTLRGPAKGKTGEAAKIDQLKVAGGDATVKTEGATEGGVPLPVKKEKPKEEGGVEVSVVQLEKIVNGKVVEMPKTFRNMERFLDSYEAAANNFKEGKESGLSQDDPRMQGWAKEASLSREKILALVPDLKNFKKICDALEENNPDSKALKNARRTLETIDGLITRWEGA